MKQILSFLLFFLPALAFAQWPAAPNKIRLGNQTTGDGLIYRSDSLPDYTPTSRNNAWLHFDTVAKKLYFYEGGTWQEYASGGGGADDWGTQVVEKDSTLRGNGTLSDPLRVNRDTFATRAQVAQALADSVAARPTGTGTTNALAKWLSSTSLGNSLMSDDGARVTAGGTAGLVLPSGTTAQRSGTPVVGETRRNSSNGYLETYDGSSWQQASLIIPSANRLLYSNSSSVWTQTGSSLITDGTRLAVNAHFNRGALFARASTTYPGLVAGGNGYADYISINSDGSSQVYNGTLSTTANMYASAVVVGINGSKIIRLNSEVPTLVAASNNNTGVANTTAMYAISMGDRVNATSGNHTAIRAVAGSHITDLGENYTSTALHAVAQNLSSTAVGKINYAVYASATGAQTNWAVFSDNGLNVFRRKTGIGLVTEPQDTLHVVGTARVTGSSTLPAASVTGRDSLGVFRDVTIGSGLSFTGGTLSATGPAANLGFTGPDTVIELDAGGTSVFIAEGSGVDVTQSGDTLTITGKGTRFVQDSITGATLTVDLNEAPTAIISLKMTSATSVTLTINNPYGFLTDATAPTYEGETGVYTFRFWGISGTDNVTWPANFYDMNGTALGTDALTAGTAYTCYYDPISNEYYCK